MSQPLVVTIPHRLGKEEAVRRLQAGLGKREPNFGQLLQCRRKSGPAITSVPRQRARPSRSGTIDVADDQVRLEVMLPWLLAKIAEKITPAIRKEGTLMLEKK